MDFSFSDEQQAIRQLAREILEAEAPVERVKAAERSERWMDEALWKQLAEANLLGIAIPEELGGMGMGFAELCVLLEEVGRVVAPGPWIPTLVAGALPLAEFGSAEQRAEWLPRVARGEATLAAALRDAGSAERTGPGTRVRVQGDAAILDGEKLLAAGARQAAALLVPASCEEGVALFAVHPLAAGVTLSPHSISTGESLCDVRLDGVRVGSDARLGGAGCDGATVLRWLEPRLRAASAALQVGVSERALRITADYVSEREQFGVPIGSFQAVQHRAADGFIDLEALRWTTWRAIWRIAEGLPAERDALVASFFAAEAGSRIAASGLHLHGGLGSDVDYPIHRYFLWSKSLELSLGGASASLARLGDDLTLP
jgi:alkylation response protein AidB-like acyl-CoA dehydrogenase